MAQLMLPHSAIYDLPQLAELRDALIRRPRDFVTPAKRVSVNWPKKLEEAVEVDYRDGSLYTTPEFEAHAVDLANWTYPSTFTQFFPEVQGIVRFKD
jgi:hypothetical protein